MTEHMVGGLGCSEATELAAGFVLGALEPDEMAAVRAHLADCPEPHPEFAEVGSVTPALLASVPQVEPSAGLRNRILDAARRDTPAAIERTREAPGARPVQQAGLERGEDRDRGRRGRPAPFGWLRLERPVWAAAGIAAVLAIAILGAQTLRLQSERDELADYQRGVAAVLDAAAQPGAQVAVLTTTRGSSGPTGIAAVGSDGAVRIAIHGLAPTSGAQVYEAWLVAAGSAAQPIGGFTVGSTGAVAFASTQGAPSDGVAVALTLEPGPGAQTPTLPIIAIGTAQAPPG